MKWLSSPVLALRYSFPFRGLTKPGWSSTFKGSSEMGLTQRRIESLFLLSYKNPDCFVEERTFSLLTT